MLDIILHVIQDFFIFLTYIFHIISALIWQILSPINYLFSFFSNFIAKIFETPVEPASLSGITNLMNSVKTAIPFWNTLALAIVIIFLISSLMTTLKTIRK